MDFPTDLILIISPYVVLLISIGIIAKIYSRNHEKETKLVIKNKNEVRKIIIKNKNEMERVDPDKIAKGLGAERGGKLPAKGGHFGAMQTVANRPTTSKIIEPNSIVLKAKDDIQVALAVAGLPTDTKQLIGRVFQFQAALPRSVERHTILGTITGFQISSQDKGVNLFISARQFNGAQITHLHIEYNEHLTECDCFLAFADKSTIKGGFRLM